MRSSIILEEWRLREFVDAVSHQDSFAFDIESQGEFRAVPAYCDVTWMSIATVGAAAVIPFGHPLGEPRGQHKEPAVFSTGRKYMKTVTDYTDPPKQIKRSVVMEMLEPLFFSPRITKVTHDGGGYDIPALAKYYDGELPVPPFDDTRMVTWLLNENRRDYRLKPIIKDTYEVEYDFDNTGACVEKHPFSKVAHYGYMDGLYTWLVYRRKRPYIDLENLTRVHEVECSQIPVLAEMKLKGQPVDIPHLESFRDDLAGRHVDEKAAIYVAAGREFNINSVPQKQALLFSPPPEGQGLKGWKLTGTGEKKKEAGEQPDPAWYSTDDDVMESLSGNAVVDALRQYGDTKTLLKTFVQSWLGNPEEDKPPLIVNGRLYSTFKPALTVTGRYSSASPNLQNAPRPSTEDGKRLRQAFIAAIEGYLDPWTGTDDNVLVVGDLGQIELVVLASLIGYGKLFDGFLNGIDPHTVHAAGVLSKRPEDVTKDERQTLGKTLGFTIVNGSGPALVGKMIGGSFQDGKRLLKKYDHDFPEVARYKERLFDACRDRRPPYITTILGRKRRVPAMLSKDFKHRSAAERQIFNTSIQGGAADILKLGMAETYRLFHEHCPRSYLTMTVHDELVAISRREDAELTRELLKEGMTGPAIQQYLKVPVKVDLHIADNWAECK